MCINIIYIYIYIYIYLYIYTYIYIHLHENIQMYRSVCRKILMSEYKRVYKK